MLDALALVGIEVFVDLALRVGGLVERDAYDAVRRGHRLGHQAGLGTLDVEVADLAEVEQALVVVRPLLHVAQVQVVGQVVDEGQAEADRVLLSAFDRLVVGVVDAAVGAITVHQVQHAVADALDHRGRHGTGFGQQVHFLGTVAQGQGQHLGRRLAEADGEATGTGTVLGGEVGGEGVGLLVHKKVDAALTVDGNSTLPVAEDGREPHVLEVVVQLGSLPRRCGELDELKTIDTHRVFKGGDLHAQVGRVGCGWGIHGLPPEAWRSPGDRR